MSKSTGTKSPTIKAVETSHAIIEVLRELDQPTVTEVADCMDISKGGVFKQLKTLQKGGFVVREDNRYRLSMKFLDIGGELRYSHPESQAIRNTIRELAEETNETTIYTILDETRTITLFRETGNHGVSTKTRIGKQLYPHETGAGKIILSHLPKEEVERIIAVNGLPAITENTITDKQEFMDELETVRERGYAFNLNESVDGLVAISVPLAPDDTILGACSVTGPYHRLKGNPINEEITETLFSSVNELELNIAHS